MLLLMSLSLTGYAQLPSVVKKQRAERERIAAAKIDTITVVEYAYKGANPEKTGRPDTKLAFDERGNKTLEARLNAKGEVDTKQTFAYDANNNCTELKSFMEFETLSYTLKSSYNAQNLLTEAVNEDNMSKSGSGRKQVYAYNGKGQLAEMKYLDSKGTVGYRDVYSYDDKGNCVKAVRYRVDESIEFKETMSYDAQGRCTETQRFVGMEFDEATAKLEKKTTYKYDAQGNVTEEAVMNAKNKLESKLVHSYDAQGLLAQTIVWGGKKAPAKPMTLRKYVLHTRP
jgi:uncharacterized protein RhaS with RHS repeats